MIVPEGSESEIHPVHTGIKQVPASTFDLNKLQISDDTLRYMPQYLEGSGPDQQTVGHDDGHLPLPQAVKDGPP